MQELARRSTAGWSVLLLLLSLVPLLALPAVAADKVTICHAAGLHGTTKFVTLEVARQAAFGQAGHFYENGTPRAGHEQDTLGACVAPTDPDAGGPDQATDDTTATTEVTTPDVTEEPTSDPTTPETTEDGGSTGATEDPQEDPAEDVEGTEDAGTEADTEGENDTTSEDDGAGPTVLPPDTKVTEDPVVTTPTQDTQAEPETEVAAAVVSAPPASVPNSVTAAPVSPPAVVTAPPADATVAAVFVAPDTLPFTGAESTTHMAYGASILLAGAAFVLAGRERKIGRHEAR